MQAVTIREAKARLNALVEAAQRGEQVVLMRGARHVALIVPLSAEDLEVAPRLSDRQAERLWREIATGAQHGTGIVAESPEAAVSLLAGRKPEKTRRKRGGEGRLPRRRR
jgi:antitoxin (DNA-binding transcriptional repressor) of toxin-antitoxin stability system